MHRKAYRKNQRFGERRDDSLFLREYKHHHYKHSYDQINKFVYTGNTIKRSTISTCALFGKKCETCYPGKGYRTNKQMKRELLEIRKSF